MVLTSGCLETSLEIEYTREAFASFPQVSEEDTPGTSVSCLPSFGLSRRQTLCPTVILPA